MALCVRSRASSNPPSQAPAFDGGTPVAGLCAPHAVRVGVSNHAFVHLAAFLGPEAQPRVELLGHEVGGGHRERYRCLDGRGGLLSGLQYRGAVALGLRPVLHIDNGFDEFPFAVDQAQVVAGGCIERFDKGLVRRVRGPEYEAVGEIGEWWLP